MKTDAFHDQLVELISEIENEAGVLRKVMQKKVTDLSSEDSTDRIVAAAALGSFVSTLYTKIEDVLTRVAKKIDQEMPPGEMWHRDLLRQMKVGTDKRPAFISVDSFAALNELLSFWHVERNTFASDLRPAELPEKVRMSLEAVDLLKRDFTTFSAEYWGE